MSEITLRLFQPEDAQQCSSIMQDHFRNEAKNLPVEVRTQIADARTTEYVQQIVTDRIIAVAMINDEIIGMGALKGNEIRHMYVRAGFKGRGVGSRILAFLEREAYYKGVNSLIVNSVLHSKQFYVKNGFKPLIESQIERHGSILEAVLLEKFLE